MRITFRQSFEEGLRDISHAAEQLAEAQRRVSSGRRLNVPSDDPAGMAAAVADRASLATVEGYQHTSDAAQSRLAIADSALSDMVNQLTSAKVAAVASRVTGRSASELDAFRGELLGIRDALMSDINTRFGSTYLFSGAAATTAPYSSTLGAATYGGDSTVVSLDVSDGRSVPITFDGGEIFQGTAAVNVLDAISALAAAVAAGDAAGIQGGIDALDLASERVAFAQSRVGNAQRTLDDTRPQLDAAHVATTTRLSAVEDADMAESISDLARAQTAQQATLGVFATLGRLTLMDYLK